MSTLLKNSIIKELNNTQWSQDSASENSDKSFEAIINGIYNYMNDSSNYTFTGTYTGSHLTTPTPTPISGTTTHSLNITNSTWLNTFKNIVRNGVETGGIQRIFNGLQTILLGTVQADISSTTPILTTYLPPLNTPMVPVIFPSIASFGSPCTLEMLGRKPNNKEDVWEIFAKYIQLGLNINVISPIPFSGTLVSNVTAIATGILTFS